MTCRTHSAVQSSLLSDCSLQAAAATADRCSSASQAQCLLSQPYHLQCAAAGGKKKKKKGKGGAKEDEDLDALLAEMGIQPATEQPAGQAAASLAAAEPAAAAGPTADEAADKEDDAGEGDEPEDGKVRVKWHWPGA